MYKNLSIRDKIYVELAIVVVTLPYLERQQYLYKFVLEKLSYFFWFESWKSKFTDIFESRSACKFCCGFSDIFDWVLEIFGKLIGAYGLYFKIFVTSLFFILFKDV